jgi:hypothetical protein
LRKEGGDNMHKPLVKVRAIPHNNGRWFGVYTRIEKVFILTHLTMKEDEAMKHMTSKTRIVLLEPRNGHCLGDAL